MIRNEFETEEMKTETDPVKKLNLIQKRVQQLYRKKDDKELGNPRHDRKQKDAEGNGSSAVGGKKPAAVPALAPQLGKGLGARGIRIHGFGFVAVKKAGR